MSSRVLDDQTETEYKQIVMDSDLEIFRDLKGDLSKIEFKRLTGLTNATYKVTNKNTEKCVLLRIFGKAEGLVDPVKEHIIFSQLGEKGVGPKCLAYKKECWRIEEFILGGEHPQHETTLRDQKFRNLLAINLAHFHGQSLDNVQTETPLVEELITNKFGIFENFNKKCKQEDDFSELEYKKVLILQEKLMDPKLLDFMKNNAPKSCLSICHNDLNNLNIFYNLESNSISFIDYEYASYNCAGYDIANFMGESTLNYNVTVDPFFKEETANIYNDDQIATFATIYLYVRQNQQDFEKIKNYIVEQDAKNKAIDVQGNIIIDNNSQYNKITQDYILNLVTENSNIDMSTFIKERQQLIYDIEASRIFVNWYWGLWSILATSPGIEMDFNHLEHGLFRIRLMEDYISQLQKKHNL